MTKQGGNGWPHEPAGQRFLALAPPFLNQDLTGAGMKKTAYQKFLERVRDKILLNDKDPFRFDRVSKLQLLYGLESNPTKTPLMVWSAMLWSGQARIKAPLWAVKMFEEIGNKRLYDYDSISLDKIFGFRAGRGETPEVLSILIQERQDQLFREAWTLTLLDYDIKDACYMVARRYQSVLLGKDKELPYRWTLGKGKKSGPGKYLAQHYSDWCKANDAFIQTAEPHWRMWLSSNREEFLRQYPIA